MDDADVNNETDLLETPPIVPMQIFVGLRYLASDVPEPLDGEDTPYFQEMVAVWQECWKNNQHPELTDEVTKKKTILLSKKNKKSNKIVSESIYSLPHELKLKQLANELKLKQRVVEEPVRTPMAHFLEDAARLRWAVETGLPVYGFIHCNDIDNKSKNKTYYKTHANLEAWNGAIWQGWPTICVLILNSNTKLPKKNQVNINVGIKITYQSTMDYPREYNCDDYYKSSVFKKFSGRICTWCHVDELPNYLMAAWNMGWKGVFLKSTSVKLGYWKLRFPTSKTSKITPGYLMGLFLDMATPEKVLSNQLLPLGEKKPAFMVQELVDFKDEYRFFVVNGRLNSGTPVRRADNILACTKNPQKREGRFRPYMCADREEDGPRHDRKRTAEYVKIAQKIVQDHKNIYLVNSEWVLDLGTNARTGEIIAIEVNTLGCAGLYGLKPSRAYSAILKNAQARVHRNESSNVE